MCDGSDKALEQLSSNTKMKSAAAIRSSEGLERVGDSVDDSDIDPALR